MNIVEQKIINAIIYFVKETKRCHKLKLFKLLYLVDFVHYKRHGFPVFNFEYLTYPMGPVPKELMGNINNDTLSEPFKKSISVIQEQKDDIDNYKFLKFEPRVKVDLDWFTPSELSVIKEIAEIYIDADAATMTEVTHLRNSPWDKTKNTLGMFKPIDYNLAVDDETIFTQDELNDRRNLYNIIATYGSV